MSQMEGIYVLGSAQSRCRARAPAQSAGLVAQGFKGYSAQSPGTDSPYAPHSISIRYPLCMRPRPRQAPRSNLQPPKPPTPPSPKEM